jgi:hypothetical protein
VTLDDLIQIGFTLTPAFFMDELALATVYHVAGFDIDQYLSGDDQDTIDSLYATAVALSS